uniref:tyrosine-type recombinase/integrase n=1 Tax=Altererythrobacter segetis TaxID=1104773 RepID=UPI00140B0782|nr:site-specific integrase [Altererythrobacter segetis]
MPDEYTLTRHRGKWSLTFRDGNRRLRITTGTTDEALARQRARELWQRRNAAATDLLADLWPVYVSDRAADGLERKRFAFHWKGLGPYFGQMVGSAITREDCRSYYDRRRREGYSDSTIKTDLELLRACLRRRYGAIAPSIWIPPSSPPRDKWLTKEQAREIADMAETPHVKLFIIVALATGARSGAILDLTWDRVDFAQGTIDFRPPGRVQTNKRRTVVPMNARAREALETAHEARLSDHVVEYGGKPVGSVKKAIARLSERAGIKFSPHVLRHTCAVWMAQADVPMQKISQYLGHTSLRMTEQVYARYSPSFMRDAGDATEF